MKNINSILFIFCLILSLSFYGQTNDSLQKGIPLVSKFQAPSLPTIDQPFNLKNLNIDSKTRSLVLYNSTTNLYDVYGNNNGGFSYSGSKIRFESKSNFFTTLFLGNDSFLESNSLVSTRSLLFSEDVDYRVRDSFNPYGASNFSEALLGGVLSLLFN